MSPASFGPESRLSSRRDFQRVRTRGRKVVGRNMILWAGSTARRGTSRLGLSVSAKVGTAVLRNRLKRLVREAFRASRARLAEGSDLVVYLRPGCRWKGVGEARKDLDEACRRAGVARA